MGTVQLLHSLTSIVLESKVRSKALLSVFRYYYYLTEVRFEWMGLLGLASSDHAAHSSSLSEVSMLPEAAMAT